MATKKKKKSSSRSSRKSGLGRWGSNLEAMRERREEFNKKIEKYIKRAAKTGMSRRKVLREMFSNPEDAARDVGVSTMAVYYWVKARLE